MKSVLVIMFLGVLVFGVLALALTKEECKGQCDSYSQMGRDCKKMCAKAKNCPHASDY